MLAGYREPEPLRRLPAACISHGVLRYDRWQFDLVTAVARDLLGLSDRGRGWMRELESYWLSEEDKRLSPPGKVHARVKACGPLCDTYERLIKEVVGPDLLSKFNAGSEGGDRETGGASEAQRPPEPETVLLYQFPPTLRIFCSAPISGGPPGEERSEGAEETSLTGPGRVADGGSQASQGPQPAGEEDSCPRFKSLGRMHNDAQYGHQPGEVNFWLPLTRLSAANTLWTETAEGRGDFQPLLLQELGYAADTPEVDQEAEPREPVLLPLQHFHGTLCRHHTQPNSSGRTRVSLDFRCAPRSAFDSGWKLPGIVHRHDMRAMHFDVERVTRG